MDRRVLAVIYLGIYVVLFLTADLWGPALKKRFIYPVERYLDEARIPSDLDAIDFPAIQPHNNKITTGVLLLAEKPIGNLLPAIASSRKTRRTGSDYSSGRDSILWIDTDNMETSSVLLGDWNRLICTDDKFAFVLGNNILRIFSAGSLVPAYSYQQDFSKVEGIFPISGNRVLLDRGENGTVIFHWMSGEKIAEFQRSKICHVVSPVSLLYHELPGDLDKIWFVQKPCKNGSKDMVVTVGYYDLRGKIRRDVFVGELLGDPIQVGGRSESLMILCFGNEKSAVCQISKSENDPVEKRAMPIENLRDFNFESVGLNRLFINNNYYYGERGTVRVFDVASGEFQDFAKWDFIGKGLSVGSAMINYHKNAVYVGYINGWVSRFDLGK